MTIMDRQVSEATCIDYMRTCTYVYHSWMNMYVYHSCMNMYVYHSCIMNMYYVYHFRIMKWQFANLVLGGDFGKPDSVFAMEMVS